MFFVKRKKLVSAQRESTPEEAEEQSIHYDVNTNVAETDHSISIIQSADQQEDTEKSSEINVNAISFQVSNQYDSRVQDLAATKIQAVFRGYLVRSIFWRMNNLGFSHPLILRNNALYT